MARALARPCRYFGCPALTHERYCEKHKKEVMNRYNKERRADPARNDMFYSSSKWRKVRQYHLTREPLCRSCGRRGIITSADTVDHIVPIRHGGADLDDMNLQSLCAPCHSRKSGEEGSTWRKKGKCHGSGNELR